MVIGDFAIRDLLVNVALGQPNKSEIGTRKSPTDQNQKSPITIVDYRPLSVFMIDSTAARSGAFGASLRNA